MTPEHGLLLDPADGYSLACRKLHVAIAAPSPLNCFVERNYLISISSTASRVMNGSSRKGIRSLLRAPRAHTAHRDRRANACLSIRSIRTFK
jgi:hypothetical protein